MGTAGSLRGSSAQTSRPTRDAARFLSGPPLKGRAWLKHEIAGEPCNHAACVLGLGLPCASVQALLLCMHLPQARSAKGVCLGMQDTIWSGASPGMSRRWTALQPTAGCPCPAQWTWPARRARMASSTVWASTRQVLAGLIRSHARYRAWLARTDGMLDHCEDTDGEH